MVSEEGKSLNGPVTTLHPANSETPHPSLARDMFGWSFKDTPVAPPTRTSYATPSVKFNATFRECPKHGSAEILNRRLNRIGMFQSESLSCGCAVTVERVPGKLKKPFSDTNLAKNWTFSGFRVTAHTTVHC